MSFYDGGRTPVADKDPTKDIQWEIGKIARAIGTDLTAIMQQLVDAAVAMLQEEIKAVVDKIVGFITNPVSMLTELGSWSAGVPLLDSVTGLLFAGWIPGLDASKIVSGLFSMGQVNGLTARFADLDAAILAIPGAQAVIDAICNALGIPGSGHAPSDVITALTNIPGLNIVSSLLSSVIPGLDASKITSGTFGQSQITGLPALLAAFPGANIVGTLFSSVIPGLDASKITSGSFSLSQLPATVLNSLTGVASSLLTGTIGTSLIPGLDASKITSGSFGQSMITDLPATLADLLPLNMFTAAATAGSNLVISPDFEDTTIKRYYDSWPLAGTQTEVVYSTEQAHSGTHSLKMTPPRGWDGTTDTWLWMVPAPGAFGDANLNGIDIKVRPGQKFYMEAWVYPKATNTFSADEFVELNFSFRDSTGVLTSSAYVEGLTTANTLTPGQWNKLTLLAEVPAGYDHTAPTLEVYNYVDAPAVNNIYYWDDVTVHEVTASQDIISQLFGGTTILGNVLASVIPGLDASKITSGLFGTSLIPGLDISKITSGLLSGGSILTSLIPGLDASKITSGLFPQSQILGLPTSLTNLTGMFGNVAAQGSNLATDSGFENSGNLWPAAAGLLSTAQARSGWHSIKLTGTGNYWEGGTFVYPIYDASTRLLTTVARGDKFYVECYVYGAATNTQTAVGSGDGLQFGADGFAADDAYVGGAAATQATTTALNGHWTKVSGYLTFDYANIAKVAFFIRLGPSCNVGEQYYVDDVIIREITESQNIIAQLFGGTTVLSTVLGSVIPGLDASKITGGTLGAGLIPGLDVSKIVSGVFGGGFIPNLDASKITSGQFAQSMVNITSIASSLLTGTLGTGLIPGLDASKITSGSFPQSMITGLTALLSAFPGGNLVGTVASSLLSGTIGTGLIPGLDASKITSGAFGTSLIPNLPASIITSGTFGTSLIPNLAASIITSGVFGAGLIPSLDASKITTGVLSETVAGVTNVWSTITTALGATGSTQTAAQTNLTTLNGRVTALAGGGVLTQYTTNATWTKPTVSPTNAVAYQPNDIFTIVCINGGQGGGKAGASQPDNAKGGVSGGYVARRVNYSDLAASYSMTIGTGGAGATATGPGTVGGTTSFGSLVTGAAGLGGQFNSDGSFAVTTPPGDGGDGAVYLSGTSGYNAPSTNGKTSAFALGGRSGNSGALAGANGGTAPAGVPAGGGGGGGGSSTAAGGTGVGGAGGFPGGGGGAGGQGGAPVSNGGAGAAGCIYVTAPY